jgi:hypothetical protein
MDNNDTFEQWYSNGIGDLPPSTQHVIYSDTVSKAYVDSQMVVNAPILCEKNQITFNVKDDKKLVLKEDGIFWYNETGEELEIKNSEVLSVALEAVVRSYFDYSTDELYKKMKKKAFDEMISDIGIQGERLIKLEKLFNEKNNE